MIKKHLVFFSIFLFFWLYKGSIFRVLNAFQSENGALSSLDVLLYLIHEDIFLYTFVYLTFTNFLPLLCS